MINKVELPIFPLTILPIPNEHIPLHIFEPRYRQLLVDIEKGKSIFGIYYFHGLNKDRLGGIVELEAVIKRYPTGEADIIVKCTDSFLLSKFYNKMLPKPYPGGIITPLEAFKKVDVSAPFQNEFKAFMALKDQGDITGFDIHDIANELELDIGDRLKYIKLLDIKKRESFLKQRLRYRKFILQQEKNIKGNFFLN